jgi:uncharacterized protein
MRRALLLCSLAVALSAFPAGVASARDVPFLSGRVNDTAGIIPADARDRIEGKLKQLEQATGTQVAVLTIDTLAGDVLEDYSLKVAQTWKLGRKGADDGALLLVARDDHKMRLEVGYGLEGKLPDAICRRILDNVLRPRFRAGDFSGGIEAGVDAIIGTLQGKDVVPKSAPNEGQQSLGLLGSIFFIGFFAIVMTPFALIALFGGGAMSWFLYFFLMPFWGAFPTAIFGSRALLVLAAWVVGFPIFKVWLRASGKGKEFLKAHPGWNAIAASSHSSSGGGWSSSSGSSSGGFSGGGGSFGGGGSSSSW